MFEHRPIQRSDVHGLAALASVINFCEGLVEDHEDALVHKVRSFDYKAPSSESKQKIEAWEEDLCVQTARVCTQEQLRYHRGAEIVDESLPTPNLKPMQMEL